MKPTKIIAIVEITLFIMLLGYGIPRWNVIKPTVGDYFCLEVFALLCVGIYDTIKTNLK